MKAGFVQMRFSLTSISTRDTLRDPDQMTLSEMETEKKVELYRFAYSPLTSRLNVA